MAGVAMVLVGAGVAVVASGAIGGGPCHFTGQRQAELAGIQRIYATLGQALVAYGAVVAGAAAGADIDHSDFFC